MSRFLVVIIGLITIIIVASPSLTKAAEPKCGCIKIYMRLRCQAREINSMLDDVSGSTISAHYVVPAQYSGSNFFRCKCADEIIVDGVNECEFFHTYIPGLLTVVAWEDASVGGPCAFRTDINEIKVLSDESCRDTAPNPCI